MSNSAYVAGELLLRRKFERIDCADQAKRKYQSTFSESKYHFRTRYHRNV